MSDYLPAHGTVCLVTQSTAKRFGRGSVKVETIQSVSGDLVRCLTLVSADGVEFAAASFLPDEWDAVVDAMNRAGGDS